MTPSANGGILAARQSRRGSATDSRLTGQGRFARWQRPSVAPLSRYPAAAPADRRAVPHLMLAARLSIPWAKDENPARVFRSGRRSHLRTVSFVVAAGWPESA